MTLNERWLPYPGAPTQWFSQPWPQTTTNGVSQPAFLLQPLGTAPGTWSSSLSQIGITGQAGTGLGINAPTGFIGNIFDAQQSGTSYFRVLLLGGGSGFPVCGLTSAYDSGTSRGYYFGDSNYARSIKSTGTGIGVYSRDNNYPGFYFDTAGGAHRASSDTGIGWSSAGQANNAYDLALWRDGAANTLAQRNGTNAQTFRVYNTYTSSTSFERLNLAWSSNTLLIGTEKGSGGGTARALEIQTDAITRLACDTTGSVRIVTALTVATLPASPTAGMMARVTNALSPTMGATVVGGGSANALTWYNGTNWTVIGI